jgi:hypothetical protein
MTYDPNFDIDAVLLTVEGISKSYEEGSTEEHALRATAAALLFVRELQELAEYREFFREITTPAIEGIKPSKTFATREDADAWLNEGTARDRDLVKIAGQGFQVVLNPDGARFLRTPLPEERGPPEAKESK